MLKNNTPFNAQIDYANRNKIKVNKNSKKHTIERRFQLYDKKAPISRRENKMRKENELLPK